MTNDYIRREDAKDALQEKVFHNLTDEFYGAMQAIDELPPADVAPAVHARWEKSDSYINRYDDTIEILICKSCSFKHYYCQGDTSMTDAGWFHFCPNCGAKMDGEG